jgi:biopolymer transport protein ExbD
MRVTCRVLIAWLLVAWPVGLAGQARPAEGPVARIAVSAKGAVSLDGKAVAIDSLRERLADVKKRSGVVWYYREAGKGEPPQQAMQVMKLIVDARLPISMSTKPDFSDVLFPDGSTRPRVTPQQPAK